MTVRLVSEWAEAPRRSLTIAMAAEVLSVDRSTVRKLLRSGKIEGHRIGKRALRVYTDSLDEYRELNAIGGGSRDRLERKAARPRLTAAHYEAEAYLRKLGV